MCSKRISLTIDSRLRGGGGVMTGGGGGGGIAARGGESSSRRVTSAAGGGGGGSTGGGGGGGTLCLGIRRIGAASPNTGARVRMSARMTVNCFIIVSVIRNKARYLS